MTLLITGASGFIGSAILRRLNDRNINHVHTVTRNPHDDNERSLIAHQGDILNPGTIDRIFEQIRPTHVIHAAWETSHGRFWSCESNRNWLSASLRLLDAFERNGGKRFVFLGSMAEYDWTAMPLIEDHSLEIPFTLYGETKLGFHRMLMQHAAAKKFSAATGRIFNLSAPNEKSERLVPQLIASIAASQRIQVGSADRERDILHVDDVADAIIALLHSDIEGAVNLAHGKPTQLGALYETLGKMTGARHLIGVGERPDTAGEPKKLYADAALIRSTGWRPVITLERGLQDLWNRARTPVAA